MKLHDFGVVAAVIIIGLAVISSVAHHKKGGCAACEVVEKLAEDQIDDMLHVPDGTAHKVIERLDGTA